jgi:hypothetical protein
MDELIKLLPAVLRATQDAPEIREAAALAAWRRAAGAGLREHAVPFRLYEQTLIVAVPDETWRKQLEPMSGKLLFRINALLGQPLVSYLEFRVDEATVNEARAALRRQEEERKALQRRALKTAASLRPAAAAIKDEALRRQFLLAAGSCLERRRKISRS